MKKSHINGIQYNYTISGSGEPLLLISGYSSDLNSWAMVKEALANHYSLITFDNQGVGQTTDTDTSLLTAKVMADNTAAFIKELGYDQVHVLGQSLGGSIAQQLAINYPHLLKSFIAMGTVTHWSQRMLTAFQAMLHAREQGATTATCMRLVLPWCFSCDFMKNKQFIDSLIEMILVQPYPQSLRDQQRQFNVLLSHNTVNSLSAVNLPTLVIAAEDDIVALPSEVKVLAKAIAGSQLVMVPGGHSIQLEQPQLMTKAVIDFLQSL